MRRRRRRREGGRKEGGGGGGGHHQQTELVVTEEENKVLNSTDVCFFLNVHSAAAAVFLGEIKIFFTHSASALLSGLRV